jgi:hypothetical protein
MGGVESFVVMIPTSWQEYACLSMWRFSFIGASVAKKSEYGSVNAVCIRTRIIISLLVSPLP